MCLLSCAGVLLCAKKDEKMGHERKCKYRNKAPSFNLIASAWFAWECVCELQLEKPAETFGKSSQRPIFEKARSATLGIPPDQEFDKCGPN